MKPNKRTRDIMRRHIHNPRALTQAEAMRMLKIQHRTTFYSTFYQVMKYEALLANK